MHCFSDDYPMIIRYAVNLTVRSDIATRIILGTWLGTQYSVLGTRYSVLGTRYSVLGTRYSYSALRSTPLKEHDVAFLVRQPLGHCSAGGFAGVGSHRVLGGAATTADSCKVRQIAGGADAYLVARR